MMIRTISAPPKYNEVAKSLILAIWDSEPSSNLFSRSVTMESREYPFVWRQLSQAVMSNVNPLNNAHPVIHDFPQRNISYIT